MCRTTTVDAQTIIMWYQGEHTPPDHIKRALLRSQLELTLARQRAAKFHAAHKLAKVLLVTRAAVGWFLGSEDDQARFVEQYGHDALEAASNAAMAVALPTVSAWVEYGAQVAYEAAQEHLANVSWCPEMMEDDKGIY